MGKPIPDRWLDYKPIGERIDDTRFIAFKVPLSQHVNKSVAEGKRLDIDSLLKSVPNLGLIIDLTNTNRYYDASKFTTQNVQYQKLMIPGKQTPSSRLTMKFCEYVNDFLHSNAHNDKLIGVHCTHGVNRTGYLICYFMITVLKMTPIKALEKFSLARGHQIERENYTAALKSLNSMASSRQQSESLPSHEARKSERCAEHHSSSNRPHGAGHSCDKPATEALPQTRWRNTPVPQQYRELQMQQNQHRIQQDKQQSFNSTRWSNGYYNQQLNYRQNDDNYQNQSQNPNTDRDTGSSQYRGKLQQQRNNQRYSAGDERRGRAD